MEYLDIRLEIFADGIKNNIVQFCNAFHANSYSYAYSFMTDVKYSRVKTHNCKKYFSYFKILKILKIYNNAL